MFSKILFTRKTFHYNPTTQGLLTSIIDGISKKHTN